METDQVLDAIKKLDARRLHEETHKENNMETINKIHQKVAKMNLSPAESVTVSSLVGQAFRAGKAEQPDPLAGYSNLTAAIIAKEPIDWERLDGLVAKCVHSTLGDLLYPLEVDGNGRKVIWESEGNFWFTTSGGSVWAEALRDAWHGKRGWTLYIEGEIPMRRKTADQLEVGTYFLGNCKLVAEGVMYVGREEESVEKAVRFVPSMTVSRFGAEYWEVVEELGTFQKPEGK